MEYIAFSKKGTIHTAKKLPCQDAYLMLSNGHQDILTVADGHGGSVYFRSNQGASFACEAAMQVIRKENDAELPQLIKKEYDHLVKGHFDSHPFTDDEKTLLGDNSYQTAYGSTLLAAVMMENSCTVLQLGDGEIHAISTNGHFLPSLPTDEDCVGSFTSSICYAEEDAVRHFRTVHYAEKPAMILMYTDGYTTQYSRPYELAAAVVLSGDITEVADNGEHGDDQTIVIAFDRAKIKSKQFICGFRETAAAFSVEVQAARIAAKREKIEEHIRELEDFLMIATKKLEEFNQSNDTERHDSLITLYEKKQQQLADYKEKLKGLE